MLLTDHVEIQVIAGKGGDGLTSFRREKFVPRGAPDGGDGGRGGDIILLSVQDMRTLRRFRSRTTVKADDGANGGKNNRAGKFGAPQYIKVPPGTIVKNAEDNSLIGDISGVGESLVVAKGGRGGRGNSHFVTSVNRGSRHSERGLPGQEIRLLLELKIYADVGLVGLPNAGKSSLLANISRARPKIGDYPFTSLEPVLGMVFVGSGHEDFVMADLPGIIEGASEGKGLGIRFLKHIERAKIILHLVDINSQAPLEDYGIIRKELESYGKGLENRPFIVAATKLDLNKDQSKFDELSLAFQKEGIKFMGISVADGTGLEELKKELVYLLAKHQSPELNYQEEGEEAKVFGKELLPYYVEKEGPGTFRIGGRRVEVLTALTKFEERESLMRFHTTLKAIGVIEELEKMGAQEGDLVRIGDIELYYEGEEDT